MKVCNVHGCPELYDGPESRCPTHRRQARSARTNNKVYSSRGHRAFRNAVLIRDIYCQIPDCIEFATVADHWPLDRRTLVDRGLNPNDPQYGRGLCHTHHSTETAKYQPGGWATPT